MEHVTGRKTVLVNISGTKPRPVPLRYLFATKEGLFPLFRDPEAGPGAPKGLLGLRGDGFLSDKGKGNENPEKVSTKLPRGLHVNPQLKAAAEKRIQKVNRAIERKKVRQMREGHPDEQDEWGVGPGKRRPMPKRKMSPRDEKRERERLLKQELRKSVPSLPIVLKRLDQKDLLPAIFFMFSRAGCDESARNVCNWMKGPARGDSIDSPSDPFDDDNPRQRRKTRGRSRQRGAGYDRDDLAMDSGGRMFRSRGDFVSEDVLQASINEIFQDENAIDEESPLNKENFATYAKSGLLDLPQVKEVAAKIESFNEENPEIAFPNDIVVQYLFGVGSHHAGMLP